MSMILTMSPTGAEIAEVTIQTVGVVVTFMMINAVNNHLFM